MSRSYKKLWKLMIDKEINKTELTKKAKISTNAMANLCVVLPTMVRQPLIMMAMAQ